MRPGGEILRGFHRKMDRGTRIAKALPPTPSKRSPQPSAAGEMKNQTTGATRIGPENDFT